MIIFVTGGTGAIGRHAVSALVAAGHEVTAMARSPQRAGELAAKGARPEIVSLFDERALAVAFAGHDAVVNLASALPRTSQFMRKRAWKRNAEVRIKGSTAVVNAALAAGVGRVIQESVVMLYQDRGAEWIDESTSIDHYPIAAANHVAEANANRFSEQAKSGVVLRFGWFYGSGATHSEEFFGLARRHVCIQMGRPDSFVSSIHVHDAGAAVVAALHAPAGTYNVVDDEPLTKRQYADALASAAEARPWLRVPGRAALLLGNRSTSLTRSLRVRNQRFKRATGWAPIYESAREGWAATATPLLAP